MDTHIQADAAALSPPVRHEDTIHSIWSQTHVNSGTRSEVKRFCTSIRGWGRYRITVGSSTTTIATSPTLILLLWRTRASQLFVPRYRGNNEYKGHCTTPPPTRRSARKSNLQRKAVASRSLEGWLSETGRDSRKLLIRFVLVILGLTKDGEL